MNIDVRSDLKEVRKLFKALGPGVDRAAFRALNDTITTVRKVGAQEIKKKHPALKIGDIKREMRLGRATTRLLTADLTTEGKAMPLRFFKPSTAKRAGVTAFIGKKRVLLGVPGRRVFQIPGHGNEYWIRKNATGRRIKRLRGPSMPGVFRANITKFRRIANERWEKAFPNRLRYEIDKAMRKARGA